MAESHYRVGALFTSVSGVSLMEATSGVRDVLRRVVGIESTSGGQQAAETRYGSGRGEFFEGLQGGWG